MKTYSLITAIILLSLKSFAQQTNPRYPQKIEKHIALVEQHLNGWVREAGKPDFTLAERMAYYHVNGVSIAVIKDFRIDWARGYGWADKTSKQPVNSQTVFQAGSVSKSVNAIALMQQVQEGKLHLDADINAGLKTWQFPYDSVSKGVRITLRHLLSHRAGLNMSGYAGYVPGDTIPNIYQILDGLAPAESSPVRSRLIPGTAFRYSGGGTMITQLMAMDADKDSYENLMQQRLFRPLGMQHSTFSDPQSGSRATGYYWDGREVKGKANIYPESAAAGLWTTPTDLAKLLTAYLKSYQGQPGGILSKTIAREMAVLETATQKERHKASPGFFVEQRGDRTYLNHDGKVEGFLSIFYIDPETGNGLVVMNNANDAGGLNIEIANSIAKVYGWKGFNVPEERNTIALRTEQLSPYTGTYTCGKDTLSLLTRPEGLFFTSNYSYYGRPQAVTFRAPEQFYVYEEEYFTDYRGYKNRYFVNRNTDGTINSIIKRVKGE